MLYKNSTPSALYACEKERTGLWGEYDELSGFDENAPACIKTRKGGIYYVKKQRRLDKVVQRCY